MRLTVAHVALAPPNAPLFTRRLYYMLFGVSSGVVGSLSGMYITRPEGNDMIIPFSPASVPERYMEPFGTAGSRPECSSTQGRFMAVSLCI